jgi:hypothetical protein
MQIKLYVNYHEKLYIYIDGCCASIFLLCLCVIRRKERRRLLDLLPQSRKTGLPNIRGHNDNVQKKDDVTMETADNEKPHSDSESGPDILDMDEKDMVAIDIGL